MFICFQIGGSHYKLWYSVVHNISDPSNIELIYKIICNASMVFANISDILLGLKLPLIWEVTKSEEISVNCYKVIIIVSKRSMLFSSQKNTNKYHLSSTRKTK